MPIPEAQPGEGHPTGDQPADRQLDLDSDAAVLDALRGNPRYREDGAPTGKSEEADPGDENDEPTAEEGDGDEGKEEDEGDPDPEPEPKGYRAALTKMHAATTALAEAKAREGQLIEVMAEMADRLERLEKGETAAPQGKPKVDYTKAIKAIRESDSDEEGAEALRELIEAEKGEKLTKAEVAELVKSALQKAEVERAGGREPYLIGRAAKWAESNLGMSAEEAAKVAKAAVKTALADGETPGPTHVYAAAFKLSRDAKTAPAPKPAKPVPPGGRSAATRPATFSEPRPTPRNVFEDRFVSKG